MEVVTMFVGVAFAVALLAVMFEPASHDLSVKGVALTGIALIACLGYWGYIGGH